MGPIRHDRAPASCVALDARRIAARQHAKAAAVPRTARSRGRGGVPSQHRQPRGVGGSVEGNDIGRRRLSCAAGSVRRRPSRSRRGRRCAHRRCDNPARRPPTIPHASAGRPRTGTRSNFARDTCSIVRAGPASSHATACDARTRRYRTLAIVAEWECDDWPPDEHTCTTIESYSEGWAWSVPLSAMRRQCTVMVKTALAKAPAEAGPHVRCHRYERELAKATTLPARLANARRVSAPWTCDASMYDCVRAAEGPVLLVGDAASFIEPLSSAGVKKALLSAWRAAVVTNTCLANPAMAEAATGPVRSPRARGLPGVPAPLRRVLCRSRARVRHAVLDGARRVRARRRRRARHRFGGPQRRLPSPRRVGPRGVRAIAR